MPNLDNQKKEFIEKVRQMFNSNDPEQVAEAIEQMFGDYRQQVLNEARQCCGTRDESILAARGVRQLTNGEKDFYQKLIDAQQSGVANGIETIPETIITQVIEDVQAEHPFLGTLKIVNTSGRTKMLRDASSLPLAVWGVITSKITQEIEAAIDVVTFDNCKLSAFMFVPKDIVELGAEWIDRYIRLLLGQAVLNALAKGFLKGTGKGQPIGAIKDLEGAVVDGEYPDKEKIALASFDTLDYCSVIAPMAVNSRTKRSRVVREVVLVCNPQDYISKVIPCTTVRAADGTYNNNIFPFPTIPVPDENIDAGEAVLMLKDCYDAFVTGNKNGSIEMSDQYRFVEDMNTYIAKLFAYGLATDNNACVYLDISGIKPANLKVEVVGTVNTQEENAG